MVPQLMNNARHILTINIQMKYCTSPCRNTRVLPRATQHSPKFLSLTRSAFKLLLFTSRQTVGLMDVLLCILELASQPTHSMYDMHSDTRMPSSGLFNSCNNRSFYVPLAFKST